MHLLKEDSDIENVTLITNRFITQHVPVLMVALNDLLIHIKSPPLDTFPSMHMHDFKYEEYFLKNGCAFAFLPPHKRPDGPTPTFPLSFDLSKSLGAATSTTPPDPLLTEENIEALLAALGPTTPPKKKKPRKALSARATKPAESPPALAAASGAGKSPDDPEIFSTSRH